MDYVTFCFPDRSVGQESICNAGYPGLIPGLGRSPGEGKGYPLMYSGLENSINCKGWQRLGYDWATFPTFHFVFLSILSTIDYLVQRYSYT